jgi:hypothetical protein
MCSTPLFSFHKVQYNLVFKELMLGLGTPTPPPQAFYSYNTPVPPPPAPSLQPCNGGKGQGLGCDRGRYHKNDGGNGGDNGYCDTPNVTVVTTV